MNYTTFQEGEYIITTPYGYTSSKYPNLQYKPDCWTHDESGPDTSSILQFLETHNICPKLIFKNNEFPSNYNIIQRAAEIGHLGLVKFLVENGANPHSKASAGANHESERDTVLHIAVYNGHYDVVEYLLNTCGADVLALGFFGNSCLENAIRYYEKHVTNFDILNLILQHMGCYIEPTRSLLYIKLTREEQAAQIYKRAFSSDLINKDYMSDELFIWFVESAKVPARLRAVVICNTCSEELLRTMHLKYHVDFTPINDESLHDQTCLHNVIKSGNLNKIRYMIDELGYWPRYDNMSIWTKYSWEINLCQLSQTLSQIAKPYPDVIEYLTPKLVDLCNLHKLGG